jgi:hypothetical protein
LSGFETQRERLLESLERFGQNQRIIEQFASEWLANIPCKLGRLRHVSSLRDVSTGRYSHPILADFYPEPAVDQALAYCHEELFDKVLESALQEQERDLRMLLHEIGAPPCEIAARWLELESFRLFVPLGAPPYLRGLFLSNMRVILGLIVAEHAQVSAAA